MDNKDKHLPGVLMKRTKCTVLALCLFLFGCGQPPADRELLVFLENGKTSSTEIVKKLGAPSATFESGRVITYRLGGDADNGFYVRDDDLSEEQGKWVGKASSLVIVFGTDGVLEAHSLVRIR